MKRDIKGCLVCLGSIIMLFILVLAFGRTMGADESVVWGMSLYEDPKASRIGDLVTVMVLEDSKAEQASLTERGRQASLGMTNTGLLSKIPGFSGKGETDYKGDLTTSRSTEVKATVTAMVTGIYPNGNLQIEGSKSAVVNGERLEVTVSGIIRPLDIQPGNVITSNYMANSNIEYKGLKKKGFWRTWTSILTFPFRLLEPLF